MANGWGTDSQNAKGTNAIHQSNSISKIAPTVTDKKHRKIIIGLTIIGLILGLLAIGYPNVGSSFFTSPLSADESPRSSGTTNTVSTEIEQNQSKAPQESSSQQAPNTVSSPAPSSHTNLSISSSAQSGTSKTNISLNGQPVQLPKSGVIEKHISGTNGEQEIYIDIHNSSSSSHYVTDNLYSNPDDISVNGRLPRSERSSRMDSR